jgi:hypothetical protein
MILDRSLVRRASPWAFALAACILFAPGACAAPVASDRMAPRASAFALSSVTMDERSLVAALADDAPAAAVAADPDLPDAPAPRGPSPALAALKSFILPGWGQLSTGHQTQAGIFLGLEAATWASWLTFKRQGSLREQSYIDTARLYAGIDLTGQDERIRRYVGQYQSEEVYNQYVVRREAAFFIEDPDEQAAYIAENSLGGEQSWNWTLYEDFVRYRDQRRSSESAYHNAEFVVGFALVNRLVSAVMAGRQASAQRKAQAAGAAVPGAATEPVATAVPGRPDGRFAWGVQPSLNGPLEGRVGWTVSF